MGFGTNRLIKQGATLVTEPKEIIDSYQGLIYKERKSECQINESIIPKQYLEIYKFIQKKDADINEICRYLKKPVKVISSILFMMELDGFAKKLPSGEYSIKGE